MVTAADCPPRTAHLAVHEANDAIDAEVVGDDWILRERSRHRGRIGESGGLDEDLWTIERVEKVG